MEVVERTLEDKALTRMFHKGTGIEGRKGDSSRCGFASARRHLATALREGHERDAAAYAMRQLSRNTWRANLAGPVADAIVAWARRVPANKRTDQSYIETVQAARDLAILLPPDHALRITKELNERSVSVFVLKTMREQMRGDTTRLVVVAGKPFEIIFENLDMMPHNLVIVQPGAREEVGLQAEKMSLRPDRQAGCMCRKTRKSWPAPNSSNLATAPY